MRITPELLSRAPQILNCLGDRELDLRGNKIAVIENLVTVIDLFETLDFSDNEVQRLENFPFSERVHTLLFNNNKVVRVSKNVGKSLPNLVSLILTYNRLGSLSDLNELVHCKNLRRLSLVGNPVTRQKHYREYIIFLMPWIRVLDFQKVKDAERKYAVKLFSGIKGEQLRQAISTAPKTFVPGELEGQGPTKEQKQRLKKAIEGAKTLDDVSKLEYAIRTGDSKLIEEALKSVEQRIPT
ncbi:U2 small nuclear ribonucleoprotein A' [Galdieria sulphuraria]|uniref:U2 small nuclear ribonucleoprotein A n=1 Tax=Galdieria sulphuraria TaxID=130081 RepID=M2WR75_GALSU|nr:U2 small nuclear ribonucleoprotein A' [Galdieria sulphuraria]EME26305.1 U2 small nuclear ribonucleoprotein A' [Galdieria sulphuraria]GJD06494.1 U2 small nuclear ribonucleoprotein A' [Galdieria sulphuraria]|eukprot:XP_005702825.1 U2 small nuclear ribonucleoprotein A' [Galdieria sulphuraria]